MSLPFFFFFFLFLLSFLDSCLGRSLAWPLPLCCVWLGGLWGPASLLLLLLL